MAATEWKTLPIKELYDGLFDGPHATPKPSASGPVFLGIKNVTDDGRLDLTEIRHIAEEDYAAWTRRVEPRTNDLVFTYEATLNRYALVPPGFRGCLGRRMALIRTDPLKVDVRFLLYYFFTEEWRAVIQRNMLTGATVDRIPLTKFPDFPVRIPPLPVQQRIAGILSAYDELIENGQRRIRILETMARALYREWFVNFRFPGHETVPRIPSPLGEIPQGWEVKKLGEIATTFRGRSYRSVDLADDGGLPFLNLKCLDRDGGFRRSGLKRYIGEYKEIHVAKKGDIVIAVTDMTQERRIVARAALVPTMDKDFGIFSMDLVRVEAKPGISKVFLYSFLRHSSFADEVKQHANGANVLHLSPERITDFSLPVPPTKLMNRFASSVEPILEEIDLLSNKMDNLRRTRDLLLPRLISGQIDVESLAIE